jgi:hypothetical protein
MSVTITKQDLLQVKLFVNLCDKLGLDYKTHHSLQRKANKLLETEARQQEQEENSKSVYETTTDTIASATTSLSTWWNSWGNQEATQEEEDATQEVKEEPCFEEKVAGILVAILEERAEEVALRRDTHTVLYDGCEC